MATFECEGHKYIADDIEATDAHEAARLFKEKHGIAPEAVDDFVVMGACEVCGETLFDGDKYVEDSEGVMWHEPECELRKHTGGRS